MAAVVRLQPCLPRNGCRVCIAAITLEDVAALQLAQPSLGKMAVKEPAQPFWCHIPRLASSGFPIFLLSKPKVCPGCEDYDAGVNTTN